MIVLSRDSTIGARKRGLIVPTLSPQLQVPGRRLVGYRVAIVGSQGYGIGEGAVSVNHQGDCGPFTADEIARRWPKAVPPSTPFADHALNVARNGFAPVVVLPGTKRPRFKRWEVACAGKSSRDFIKRHASRNPTDSVGIACGVLRDPAGESLERLWGYDIDTDDQAEADRHEALAVRLLGPTPFVRTRPNSPRRVLLYRTKGLVKSEPLDGAEILGADHQFVAFGLHPSRVAYAWRGASPADTPATAVPLVSRNTLDAFRRAAGAKMAETRPLPRFGLRKSPIVSAGVLETITVGGVGSLQWRWVDGLVIDGREAFLAFCIGKSAGDAQRAWRMFTLHADLDRPKGSDPSCWWSIEDAEAKARTWKRNSDRREAGTRSPGRPRTADREPLNAEQRQAHTIAVERAHREGRIGVAAVLVSRAMLDLAGGSLGMCTGSLATIGATVDRSRSIVTTARAELVVAGFWEHRRSGAYVPIVMEKISRGGSKPSIDTVCPHVGPKYQRVEPEITPDIASDTPRRADEGKGNLPEMVDIMERTKSWREAFVPALAAMKIQVRRPRPISLGRITLPPMRNLDIGRAPARGFLGLPVRV